MQITQSQRISEVILEISNNTILELVTDKSEINVPVDPRIAVDILTADDPDPMFVNIEIIRTGISRTNRRKYSNENVREISMMIPGVQGYLGHPDPSKHGFEFRDPHCIYVGSMIQELDDGSGGIHTIGKAYIFKSSPLREWVPKSIAAGRPMTVSINALGDIIRDTINNLIIVKQITRLDSIDWANPGTEGVGTSQAISVVSEMQNNSDNKGGVVYMERQEVVKGVTVAEMKAYNPDAIGTIVKGVSMQELQSLAPELCKQIAESGRITEMQLKVDGKESAVKLSDVQGIIDTRDIKITELQDTISTMQLTEYKNELLADVPEAYRTKVSERLIGKTKDEIKASVDKEVGYIREIAGSSFDNLPKGKTQRSSNDDIHVKVKNLFGVKEPAQK